MFKNLKTSAGIFLIAIMLVGLFTISARAAESTSPNLEDNTDWVLLCKTFTNTPVKITCPTGTVTEDYFDKKIGTHSVVLTGTESGHIRYTENIVVKPNTKYKISFWLKHKERKIFNYLNVTPAYPPAYTNPAGALPAGALINTKGVWAGQYYVRLNMGPSQGDVVEVLPKTCLCYSWGQEYLGWHQEEEYFQTSNQTQIPLLFILEGFDGKLMANGIKLEEVTDTIADKYFTMAVPEYAGMKITKVTKNPLVVETNAARFEFIGDTISMKKKGSGVEVSKISFPSSYLSALRVLKEPGNVIIENNNLKISIGGDSVMLVKLKHDADVTVNGPKPKYHSFQAGVIFATDYTQGVFFAPLRPSLDNRYLATSINLANLDWTYNDASLSAQGRKYWTPTPANFYELIQDSSHNVPWQVKYSFTQGGGFMTQIFPPKEFDEKKYCTERAELAAKSLGPQIVDLDTLKKFRTQYNIDIVWHTIYEAQNTLNPRTYYCVKNDKQKETVDCDDKTIDSIQLPLMRNDLQGPYGIIHSAEFKNFIDLAHSQDIKVVLYMTPAYYYTSDVDIFIKNLQALLDNYKIDGVYFDGLTKGDPLRALELVRRTRAALGDRLYIQHLSPDIQFTPKSTHFRVPAFDAYADQVWDGENQKLADDDTWRLNYAGQNVSNTVSEVLAETRPVDFTKSEAENRKSIFMSGEEQIDKILKYKGIYRVNRFAKNDTAFLRDTHKGWATAYKPSHFLDKYNASCLATTCGNNKCDVGETFSSCPHDCASPPTPTPAGCRRKAQGDANCDGKIDLIDFNLWRQQFTTGVADTADFNSNGKVDLVDFNIWRDNFLK